MGTRCDFAQRDTIPDPRDYVSAIGNFNLCLVVTAFNPASLMLRIQLGM